MVRGAERVCTHCPLAVCLHIGVYPGGREGSLPPPSAGRTGPNCCLCLRTKPDSRPPSECCRACGQRQVRLGFSAQAAAQAT